MFYGVTQKIRELLLQDVNVNTVTYGELDEVALNKFTTYPLAHFNVSGVTRGKSNVYDIQLFLMDILDQSKDVDRDFIRNNNLHDVLNTQEQVGMRLLELLVRGDLRTDGFMLTGSPGFIPFIERFKNDVAGWEVTFQVEVPNDMDICNEGGLLYNTRIDGEGYNTTTKEDLETLLGLSSGDVSYFELSGQDIFCKIDVPYSLPFDCFRINADVKTYYDYEDLCGSLGDNCFRSATSFNDFRLRGTTFLGTYAIFDTAITKAILPSVTSTSNLCLGNNSGLNQVHLPLLNMVGTSPLNNNCFLSIRDGVSLTIGDGARTNNGGNPDGDVQYVIDDLNGSVTYVE